MSDLVRFGVAMDRALLGEFDERIAQKGYENRSEALRDLVRADLTKAAWDGGAAVAGTLTLVYTLKHADNVARLVLEASKPESRRVGDGAQSTSAGPIVSALRVTLDETRALEVLVLRGRATQLTDLAGRIGGARGVLSAELAIACAMTGSAQAAASALGASKDDEAKSAR
jgi:CopG family transcriptional regulator, nickel-responsive regulator